MPNWKEILDEIKSFRAASDSACDITRRKYLSKLYEKVGRNIIIYYSGWLQKGDNRDTLVNDNDKNGFMNSIYKLDRSKGLDLIIHTPGGEAAATESIVDYLRSMFGINIRAIIPQLALSAGTMIACSCKEIVMGKESNLGPIDPQFMGFPAHGVIEEFENAYKEIQKDKNKIHVWQPIIAKYRPTLIGECQKSIVWSKEMVTDWLISGMFNGEQRAEEKAKNIYKELGDHALTKSHARHLSFDKCKEIGLKVMPLEEDGDFQDLVLSVHHSCMITFGQTRAIKIIENHEGAAFIQIK